MKKVLIFGLGHNFATPFTSFNYLKALSPKIVMVLQLGLQHMNFGRPKLNLAEKVQ